MIIQGGGNVVHQTINNYASSPTKDGGKPMIVTGASEKTNTELVSKLLKRIAELES